MKANLLKFGKYKTLFKSINEFFCDTICTKEPETNNNIKPFLIVIALFTLIKLII